jgi:hypothetical protein
MTDQVLCARCDHPETWHTAIGIGGGSCYAHTRRDGPACPCDGFLHDPATLDALPGPHLFADNGITNTDERTPP